MLRQLQHTRFTTMPAGIQERNELSSLPGSDWYVQAYRMIERTGNVNDIHKRPDHVHT